MDKIIPNGEMVNLGDYSVHVYSEGENEEQPTLVFLSGWGTVAPVYDFKPLYSLLSEQFKIAVVEKAGYGYSDIVDVDRSVEAMVDEVRSSLNKAEILSPYVLIPHSMSGLEAIYWAQNFPDEVEGIIGLDMAVPYSYDNTDSFLSFTEQMQKNEKDYSSAPAFLKSIITPTFYKLNSDNLTNVEMEQQNLLMYKNAVNRTFILELNNAYDNAQKLKTEKKLSLPILMFSTTDEELDNWLEAQQMFANENDVELIIYNCGHYIHHFESVNITKKILEFLND